MTLLPMASLMAATEPKWVSVWSRFLWLVLLSTVLGSLLALLLPLGAVEEQCLAILKGFYLLRSQLDTAQQVVTKHTSPSTELSVSSRDAGLLVLKTKASPGKTAGQCVPRALKVTAVFCLEDLLGPETIPQPAWTTYNGIRANHGQSEAQRAVRAHQEGMEREILETLEEVKCSRGQERRASDPHPSPKEGQRTLGGYGVASLPLS